MYTNLLKLTTFLVLFLTLGVFTSCVSKKKLEETLLNASQRSQQYEEQLFQLEETIFKKDMAIDSLRILYAEKKGANEVLLITQDKLQDRLDDVQNQVLAEQKSKTSTAQDLQSVLADKEESIRQRDAKLTGLQEIIDRQAVAQNTMLGEFTMEVERYGMGNFKTKVVNGELRISLSNDLFFRPGQDRVKTDGVGNLARMAGLINKYPSIKVNVIGNTDNSKVARGFKDNLELSALRAANVVRVLTDEYGVSPNRILAGGKGDSAPVASNETSQGKMQNKRIDFIVTSRMDRVVRDLDKYLKE